MLTTSACLSAGTPGGMFAPTLFIGAMIGGGLGGLANLYWPFPTSSAGAYVLVGMGTFFAGLFRAPMTSVFMVFEVSATYVIILPVMIANTISFLISRHLQHDSLFQITALQDGLDLPSVEDLREAPTLSVEDAMKAGSARVLAGGTSVSRALEDMKAQNLPNCLVSSSLGKWSWVSREDLEKAIKAGKGEQRLVQAVVLRSMIRMYPDVSLDSALRMLGLYPILPVSSRANPKLLLGTLTLEDVHRAYGISAR
jgi:CIC family chloride channel protein